MDASEKKEATAAGIVLQMLPELTGQDSSCFLLRLQHGEAVFTWSQRMGGKRRVLQHMVGRRELYLWYPHCEVLAKRVAEEMQAAMITMGRSGGSNES